MGRDNPLRVTEAQFANEFWKIMAKLKSPDQGVIYVRVDERGLQMSTGYTLDSLTYADGFALSMVHKGSNLFGMLKRLRFLSSHVQLEPLVVIPFVKAVKEYYDPLRTRLEHYALEGMGMAALEENLARVGRDVHSVVSFFSTLFEDVDGSNPIAKAVFDLEKVQNQLPNGIIEKTWTRFIHFYFMHLENVDQVLPIWSRLNAHLLEVVPAYLDSMCGFESIEMIKETDELVLTKTDPSTHITSSHKVFLRKLWSDKLISLLTRAFLDQRRLCAQQQDRVKLTKWSYFFNNELELKKTSTKLISPEVLTEMMERSCSEFGLQFSRQIFDKLNNNKQLERRLQELQAIYDLKLFAQVYANCYVDDAKNNDKNVRFLELKKALKSPLLPPNIDKYWGIVTSASSTNRFCAFKFVFKQKGTWPVSLVISEDLMADLSRLMDLWSRFSYHNITLNGLVTAGLVQTEDGRILRFERRTQHFVAALRQVLYRVTVLMQNEINRYVRTLAEKVLDFNNLNDLERFVVEWRNNIQSFFHDNSLTYSTLIGLCDLTDEMTDLFTLLLKSPTADQWTFLLQIRQLFVHHCDQLSGSREDYADYKSFEAKLTEVVKSIIPERFCL